MVRYRSTENMYKIGTKKSYLISNYNKNKNSRKTKRHSANSVLNLT